MQGEDEGAQDVAPSTNLDEESRNVAEEIIESVNKEDNENNDIVEIEKELEIRTAGTQCMSDINTRIEKEENSEYEERYENGTKEPIKERRTRSRFESLGVVAAMGKSKRQRNNDKKTDKEEKMDDVIAQSQDECRITGGPQRDREVGTDRPGNIEDTNKEDLDQYMDHEDTENEQGKEIDRYKKKAGKDRIEQDTTGKTMEDRNGYGMKMVRHEGRMKYIEQIKNMQEYIRSQGRKEESYRFDNLHKGEIMLEAVLDTKERVNNRNMNTVRIIQYMKKIGCSYDKIKHCGFGKAEVIFKNVKDANKTLDVKGMLE